MDMDKLFTQMTNIKVNLSDHPEECVVRGLDAIVSDPHFSKLPYAMKSKAY